MIISVCICSIQGSCIGLKNLGATCYINTFLQVSKIIPSPDWIVGVSMENLCLANGSWVDSRVVDLYPWDAGTNSGLSYQATLSNMHEADSRLRLE